MIVKRLLDVIGATIVLLVASPLLAAAAVALLIEGRSSPVYVQRRVGYRGVEFDIYKLRTMVPDAEKIGSGWAVNVGDPRITRVGALLRRFSLDELPNLVNVLRGQMSLVGPRPTLAWQVERYTDRQRRRLEAKPGITGWAQVNGRTSLPWDERIELDVWYVDHRSLALDLKILWRTARTALAGRGLYKGASGGWRPSGDNAERDAEPAKPPGPDVR